VDGAGLGDEGGGDALWAVALVGPDQPLGAEAVHLGEGEHLVAGAGPDVLQRGNRVGEGVVDDWFSGSVGLGR